MRDADDTVHKARRNSCACACQHLRTCAAAARLMALHCGLLLPPQVPEGFSRSSLEALLLFLYRDELADGLEPADVVQLLHVAAYYGTPR